MSNISISMMENKIELLEEDLECVNMFLDSHKIPKTDGSNTYSIIGRIEILLANTRSLNSHN